AVRASSSSGKKHGEESRKGMTRLPQPRGRTPSANPAPRAQVGVLRYWGPPFRDLPQPLVGKKEACSVSGFPPSVALFPLPSREIKSRKKRDHGEFQAVLLAHQNKFLALPKSPNFHRQR